MFSPFFKLAAVSPGRQQAFRYLVVFHLILLTTGTGIALQIPQGGLALLGHGALIAGIIEGALLIGWRLTQLPKSQALEFLLVSPLRPRRLLVAELTVGLTRLALVNLSGLPLLALLVVEGILLPGDLPALILMPWTWGAVTGLVLVAWAYENLVIRRWGERVVMVMIVVYLAVGVLAAEKLAVWVADLPGWLGHFLVQGFRTVHGNSPFTILRDVLQGSLEEVWDRFLVLETAALGLVVVLGWRSACRLQGHFRDRHYRPAEDVSRQQRRAVGDWPLSWWAVKRVSEYSGRVNLWLAGGFAILYAAYTVAGPAWPAWLGSLVFETFDQMGGIPAVATALVVLSAVPAAFQYGLWDSSAQDRCRRLELLLLTDLQARDYWQAAAAAAWRRGRGYFTVALLLWVALLVSGRADPGQVVAGIAAGVTLWGLYFALGFRAFARGAQANGLGLALTVGLPLIVCVLFLRGLGGVALLLPPGSVYYPATASAEFAWMPGPLAAGALALVVGRRTQRHCLDALRRWYDQHHGQKGME
jgi:hypothetical protein